MYAWIVILAVFGAGLSLLFDRIEEIAVPWRGQ
jgi:ABC-type nitrate/sulfonate/bicarbonate transport system permease component